jgi:hypothetical protein
MLQLVFLIMSGFGVVFYFRGPPQNEAQALFRIGSVAVGIVGFLVVTAIKLSRGRRS